MEFKKRRFILCQEIINTMDVDVLRKLVGGFHAQYLLVLVFAVFSYRAVLETPAYFIAGILAIWFGTAADIAANRTYDAKDDEKLEWKRKINPVSNGEISKNTAKKVCIALYLASIVMGLLTKNAVFFSVLVVRNFIGFFYSAPPIRAKSTKFLDVLFHLFIIDSGPALMTLVLTQNYSFTLMLGLFILVLNSVFTEINQEMRDYEIDRKTGLETTVILLGLDGSLFLERILLFMILLVITTFSIYGNLYLLAVVSLVLMIRTSKKPKDYKDIYDSRALCIYSLLLAGFINFGLIV